MNNLPNIVLAQRKLMGLVEPLGSILKILPDLFCAFDQSKKIKRYIKELEEKRLEKIQIRQQKISLYYQWFESNLHLLKDSEFAEHSVVKRSIENFEMALKVKNYNLLSPFFHIYNTFKQAVYAVVAFEMKPCFRDFAEMASLYVNTSWCVPVLPRDVEGSVNLKHRWELSEDKDECSTEISDKDKFLAWYADWLKKNKSKNAHRRTIKMAIEAFKQSNIKLSRKKFYADSTFETWIREWRDLQKSV
jgi:ubiquitin C-terminal hydrolase